MEITYKEFFEKSKNKPNLQGLINRCAIAAIKTVLKAKEVFPDKPPVDAGELMLSGLATLAKTENIILTNREEITAEYMAGVLNSYT